MTTHALWRYHRALARAAALAVFGVAMLGDRPGIGADAQPAPPPVPASVERIDVTARQITQFRALSGRRSGELEFRGGLVLTSPSPSFGGWSGVRVEPDGRRLLAVSDEGTWMRATIAYQGQAPVGLSDVHIGPIRALKGRRLEKKRDRDAEALALVEGNLTRGTVLIAFERNHRIGVFPVVDGDLQPPVRYLARPEASRRMRPNLGFEAVTVLKGGRHRGRVVAFAERFPGEPGRHKGWIWIDGVPRSLGLIDHGGFDITDAASLPDGTLLLLERRFRWTEGVKMRLRRIAAEAVRPGALLDGEILLEADMSSEIDNMEGLATHRGPSGETVLTLISDNNFNTFLQRNLLLQFTLLDRREATR